MCLTLNRAATLEFMRLAPEEITVYKVVVRIDNTLTALYQNYIYTPGQLISTRFCRELEPEEQTHGTVYEGFHVCLTKEEADNIIKHKRECHDKRDLKIIKLTVRKTDCVAIGYWDNWCEEDMPEPQGVFMEMYLSQEEYDKATQLALPETVEIN